MSNGDGHSRRCEEAVGHKCVCTVCGGARHGWPGWLGLATASDHDPLGHRARGVQEKWDKSYDPSKSRQRKLVREACIDFARLDIVGWLRTKRASSTPESVRRVDHSSHDLPPRSTSDFAGPDQKESGAPDAQRSDRAGTPPPGDEPPSGSPSQDSRLEDDPAEQALELAGVIAIPAWHSVRELVEDEGDPDTVLIKKQLASHTWCDLFVGMALSIQQAQGVLDEIPQAVKRYVLQSSMQAGRPVLTERIEGLLVDKAWDALLTYATGRVAGLGLITGAPLLRSLRILAYLSCPDPDKHRAVREDALKPLEEDVVGMLKDETKQRLGLIFEDWVA